MNQIEVNDLINEQDEP